VKLITRRWAVLGAIAILAASITAGGVIAAQLTTFENPDRLAKAIEKDPLVLAADIPAAGGAARHSVLVQETSREGSTRARSRHPGGGWRRTSLGVGAGDFDRALRNTSSWTETYAPYSPFRVITDKGHCKANVGYFWGSCSIY